ncbi:MAG TPA: glycosyltransferase [Propionibacteriaceae bacterium]|nr:glycosyltransferase [Propionibacteriaceae bacterium]
MRIAMVSEHASPLATLGGVDAGGQNVHVAALAGALADRGHEVVVYTRADRPSLPRRVAMRPRVQVEHVTAGPAQPVAKDELLPYMGTFAAGLAQRWADERPDVVHAHFWMSGLASIRAGARCGVPVVQTFHALGTVKRRWQGDLDTSPATRIDTERWIAGSADRIIATCTDEVAELRAMGVTAEGVDVVPCGVDVSLFTPAADEIRAGRSAPRLLIVSRLVPRKGVEDAIRALALTPAAELVIVGGPSADRLDNDPEVARLRQVAAECRVAKRVRWTGHLRHDELPAVIRSCDVLLAVPWYEPFGITVLEAMSCGVPVVASAVGGLLDTVVPGVTGVLVHGRDPQSIAAGTGWLLSDEQRRAAMGRAGAERVRNCYSWPRVAERTEQSYRRALEARSALSKMAVSR